MSELALFGGPPVIDRPLTPYRSIGEEERLAADRVMRSGLLSGFVGAWCDAFHGGPEVRAFEAEWAQCFGARFAVSVNSCTSGLIAAMGAIGLSPGEEVIVPPYTMSATAMAPLFYGGIPVFADIEPDTFCLDPARVAEAISPRTRAIIAVNLFGHPAALHELRALVDRHGIALVEDNAQGPLATERGRMAGTIGHIGVFSLNYHKHIHTGEGGVCTTDDPELASRLMAIRNHGENVVGALELGAPHDLIGQNYRLSELAAAIGREQLRKAEALVADRERVVARMTQMFDGLAGITPPMRRHDCRHVYYVWAARCDARELGVPRAVFARALAAEGFPVSEGYVEPLYRLPTFRDRIAIGRDGWPFTLSNRTYEPGMCPVVERMHAEELLEFHVCSYEVDDTTADALAAAVHKVYAARDKLRRVAA